MTLSLGAHFVLTFYLIGSTFAFFPASLVPKTTKIAVGQGSDNDDFLDSLSNAEDTEPEGTYKKFLPSDEEEKNQGGTRFQQMVEAAKAAKSGRAGSPSLDLHISTDPSPPPTQSLADQSMENMSVDQQAAMFRAMMQQQQPPPTDYSPQSQKGLDAKGRKIGRNRDADTIANTADLYFAQLKRDSSVRTMARIEGDDDIAEKVFEDEAVQKLKDQIKKNPYLEREREESKSLIESVAEGMMIAEKERKESEKNRNTAGPSYKKNLEAKRKNNRPTQSSAPLPAPEPVAVITPSPAPEPVVVMQPPSKENAPSSATIAAPQATQLSAETNYKQSQIRTLMGMFLKHRGGSGFGSGRLRGSEIDDFETLLKEVGRSLRQEAGTRQSPVLESPASVDAAPKPLNVSVSPETSVVSTASAPVAPEPVIDAVTQQTLIPPPPPISKVAAMTTVNAALIDPAVQAALQCVEGAIQMYKNSPPDLAPGMLMAVRAAMLNAAEKCKLVIENDSVQNKESATFPDFSATAEQSKAGVSPHVAPTRAFSIDSTQPTNLDSNSALLRKVYDALGNASGDGKFGLGPITSEEVSY